MIGETISHYRVVAKVGAGGMGEVYRAHDPRLKRDVAIKVLAAAATSDPTRIGRFEREARSTGALNHPNILAIYDVGQHDGVPYIVTELLEGRTLRQQLRDGTLPPRRMVEYSIQIADGLAAAHAKGIIHRDLKPENIFITSDGHLKILDFGLAKLQQPDGEGGASERVTQTMETEEGAIVGTLGYMSPEQLHGRQADMRSDIFAFGAVMYEMLAGRRAFSGDSKANVVAAILRDDPPEVRYFSKNVPPQLEQLIRRCLEKRPEDRFASAHDLSLALQSVQDASTWSGSGFRPQLPRFGNWKKVAAFAVVAAAAVVLGVVGRQWLSSRVGEPLAPMPDEKRLIILPFETAESADAEGAVLARGITEWLAESMVLVEQQSNGAVWAVPPRPLSDEELEGLRRNRGMTLVTRGEVNPSELGFGTRLSLTDARSQRVVMRRIVAAERNDVCASLIRLAIEHANMLGVVLDPATLDAVSGLTPGESVVCRDYLLGLGLLRGGETVEDVQAAAARFEKVGEAAGSFAPAFTALAESHRRLYERTRDSAWFEAGIDAANQAIEADRSDPGPWMELARLESAAGNKVEAIEALEEASRRARRWAVPHRQLGVAFKAAGEFDRAENALQRAVRLRPNDGHFHSELGAFYWSRGEPDAASNHLRAAAELTPENALAYSNVCGLYLSFDWKEEARQMCERSLAIEPNYTAYSNLGTLAFSNSNFGRAVEMFVRANEIDDSDYYTSMNLGLAYYHMDNERDSRPALQQAVTLLEEELEATPGDRNLMLDLADCEAVLGNRNRAIELLDFVTQEDRDDPRFLATVGEVYEEAGERELAIQWLTRALDAGLEPAFLRSNPTLRKVQDYRDLADQYETDHSS